MHVPHADFDHAVTAVHVYAFVSRYTSLRKDIVANYASIWTLFSTSVAGLCTQSPEGVI